MIRENEGNYPTDKNIKFLNLAYNKFLDIFDIIQSDKFFFLDGKIRLFRIQQLFSIYSELLRYQPIKEFKKTLMSLRPQEESIIGYEFFDVIRHLISHFQFYDCWNEIRFSRDLILWNDINGSINKFMVKYENKEESKYRIFNKDKQKFMYITINYPHGYSSGEELKLCNLISELEGIKFTSILMKRILMTQVESISKNNL